MNLNTILIIYLENVLLLMRSRILVASEEMSYVEVQIKQKIKCLKCIKDEDEKRMKTIQCIGGVKVSLSKQECAIRVEMKEMNEKVSYVDAK